MKSVASRLLAKAAGPTRATTRRRKWLALAVAATSDVGRAAFAPLFVEGATSPLDVAVDVVTALAILLLVGAEWRLALALGAELVPGLALFPTWSAVVLTLPVAKAAEPEPPTPLG